jgi:hypothetical protein
MQTTPVHRCAAPGCPGRPYRASDRPHPPDCGKKQIAEIAEGLTGTQQNNVLKAPQGGASFDPECLDGRSIASLVRKGIFAWHDNGVLLTWTPVGRVVSWHIKRNQETAQP